MSTSTNLGFDYLDENQSGKVVTINSALLALDTEIGRLRLRNWVLMGGYTPAATGADAYEFTVPYAEDGTTVETYTLKGVYFRHGVTGTGNSQIKLQKMSGTGQFNTPTDLTGTITIAASAYEPTTNPTTTFTVGTVQSGDKIRVNVIAIGSGSGNWAVEITAKKTA